MVVKTLFAQGHQFTVGEVEIKLLPGIPMLHVVGLPDAHIRECGLRLKSALRTCDLEWPQGHQIVVNLRPGHFRKSSSGIDLPIALGFLALTNQLTPRLKERLQHTAVFGEVALDGRVYAPSDLMAAMNASNVPVISGAADSDLRQGQWLKLERLSDEDVAEEKRTFDWEKYWHPPEFADLNLHPQAFEALCLAAHMELNVLVAGPQGSGKSTWARALYALSAQPRVEQVLERQSLFPGDPPRWRPCESPHHSITPLAMIGGGAPLFPGVISRAHGGVLIMDEFLQYHPLVLEALREPLQNGFVDQARRGERARFPAQFQLVGTANLCPCGHYSPGKNSSCGHTMKFCRSVIRRLSGPVMDRFDILVFSHQWLKRGERRPWQEAKAQVERMHLFAKQRGDRPLKLPVWVRDLELSHRRRNALLRVARGLADADGTTDVDDKHFHNANCRVVDPMARLGQLFA